ncbi:uncharacterized protein LOC123200004 isoform X2 [Mangifera indica]|nr:uncharacterized protein LOC123200004 isoform X2 [Mangifera indica]XP_044471011.1 uncharacterized protein LOC123200004 isoform X2 [Mangifera indica]XP_044471012.1 uncharacterized protein LOC123200004 isoform X2 [Mangifera indica]XP_044471013.1 uncharacterized protein LOC123200004 isoform X2 [Mangifera indica]
MAETEVKAMKETLCAQQQLLQNLSAELDVEREASGTAVSEALSMILRLQEEKSAIVMEASQYKRMAEEKISHAEETLESYEDILYQKEMEISALEFQIQAYKCRLLSLGCTELGVSIPTEDLYMQRSDVSVGEGCSNSGVRRLRSLPPLQLDDIYQSIVRGKSLTPEPEMVPLDEKTCQDFTENGLQLRKHPSRSIGGDLNSYWEQIKKLDEKVKEFADPKDTDGDKSASLKPESRPVTLLSQLSSDISSDLRRCKINTNLDMVKECKAPMDREEPLTSSSSSSVCDVFEVPKVIESSKSSEKDEKGKNKWIWDGENRLGKPDPVVDVTLDSEVKDKAVLHGTKLEKKLLRSKEIIGVDSKRPLARHKMSHAEIHADFHHEFQQLGERIERLEGERHSARHSEREEELNLLKEIREQLNSVQAEMRSWRTKESHPVHKPSLLPIQEAMLRCGI